MNKSYFPCDLTVHSSIDPPVILLAEDDFMNQLTICDYLEVFGYSLIVANNGIEAVEKAQQVQPKLILMDISMPKMDGLQAIAAIRQIPELVNTPIIALTAFAMKGDQEKCLTAGANYYVTKPIKFKDLVALMQNCLA
ncbi:response regulator [Gloeothece verrucosa]|uniref:Response regulator receiver protein n=1 Tax=Gloeothece verrucosa (strain PCC 7822) TaxID=497965 RepID=E0U6U0_GLOV7|nr:response regulator [Gloeothece verrucosa]ADN15977.1 response regulator receiver protein [Gloeothece verrucosa PCC 7822]